MTTSLDTARWQGRPGRGFMSHLVLMNPAHQGLVLVAIACMVNEVQELRLGVTEPTFPPQLFYLLTKMMETLYIDLEASWLQW